MTEIKKEDSAELSLVRPPPPVKVDPSPSSVKREGEAAEALLLLSHEDKKKKKAQQNGDDGAATSSKKVKTEAKPEPPEKSNGKTKSEPVAGTSNGSSSNGKSATKKKKAGSSDDDHSDYEEPAKRKKADTSSNGKSVSKKKTRDASSDEDEDSNYSDDEDDYKPKKKAKKASPAKPVATAKKADKNGTAKKNGKDTKSDVKKKAGKDAAAASPTKSPRKKKAEEEVEVWRWWEENDRNDDIKWKTLAHKGPIFAPDYEPLPKGIKFKYDGKTIPLSQDAEEVATFYAKMLDHEYVTKKAFNDNFMRDWRKVMTAEEKAIITDLKKCDFTVMAEYFKEQTEIRKNRSKEEKNKLKEANEALAKEYGVCMIDGHKEKVGNFRIEPPGLFRGRGEHPKMGSLKHRVHPENVIINCSSRDAAPRPPAGHKWKEVRHDNKVTWLACWTDNILGSVKYVMLNPSSKLKGQKDMQKYEVARKLKKKIGTIRDTYKADMKSKEMRIRQRAVALYFIDKLALRAGNEKEEGETADTVGCCSLRVEHIALDDEKEIVVDGKREKHKYVVTFDFPGKDSIRYFNEVPVDKRAYKNLKLFVQKKNKDDDLFDRLNTTVLNKHLGDLMEGLTAKVFRTYNASFTLQDQLDKMTNPKDSVHDLMLTYNRANRAVAILCNHQRSAPKTFDKQMENAKEKIAAAELKVKTLKAEAKAAKKDKDPKKAEALQSKLNKAKEALHKLEITATDKEENKTIALGTSKLNYLDPRISVAWCKKYKVPIEKVYNKTQRSKFNWAIDMAGPEFVF
ncbi:DNA topoisomerase 1 [Hypsibius exemplaris]|uniref:DNA topoisomerase I n=1 Tax=Hypsibius exemplaris TaxID=2072580 RepID=A0A1W0WBB3_HYPEX|nr:DNA topoisomerase 1 [Hypsibius exemplaris]